jgi:predicted ATP-dependent serine protease
VKYVCALCGAMTEAYAPKCPACDGANALRVSTAELSKVTSSRVVVMRANTTPEQRTATGLGVLDVALGEEEDGSRGFVHGAAYILTGTEGAGKSTLALLIAEALARLGVLYIATEEHPEKVERRITRTRLGLGLPLLATADVREAVAELGARKPGLAIVDSLHGLRGKPDDNARALLGWTRSTSHGARSLLVVAHEVKDGTIAGPKTLAYLFDATIRLVADDGGVDGPARPVEGAQLARYLVTRKNRYGLDGTWRLRLGARGWEDPTPPAAPPSGMGGDDGSNVVSIDAQRGRARRRRG